MQEKATLEMKDMETMTQSLIQNYQELKALKTGKNRLLGLDVGTKTVGLALSDITWLIATPHKLIKRKLNVSDYQEIKKVVVEFGVVAFVVGLPLNMNGTDGPQAQKVRDFMEKLTQIVDIPLFYWDERLSTVAATRTLLEADMSRSRRAEVVDKMAATFILQGVLDMG